MVDKAGRTRPDRERLPRAETVHVPRTRLGMAWDLELIDWVNENSAPGGPFRSHGDASERALGRLRTELQFIRDRCAATRTRFEWPAFRSLYAADLEAAPRSVGGRPRLGQRTVKNALVEPMVATELIGWANETWLQHNPDLRIAQVIEIGVRRLRTGEHRLDPDSPEPKVTLPPDELWQQYEAALATVTAD